MEGLTHRQLVAYFVAALAFFFVVLMNTAANRPTNLEVREIIGDKIEVVNAKLDNIDKKLDGIEKKLDRPTGEQ